MPGNDKPHLEGSARRPSASSHFVAGLSTGILSASLLQPADLLKTRVQQAGSASLFRTCQDILRAPNALRHLWRGTFPSVVRTGLGSAFYFTTLNVLRQRVATSEIFSSAGIVVSSSYDARSSSSLPRLSNAANLGTGAMARAFAGMVMMPITVIKVRFESNLYSYKSIWDAGKSILKSEGLRGLFSGTGATVLRDAPYAGLYVLFYEQSKQRLSQLLAKASPIASLGLHSKMTSWQSIPINFVSGAVAAGLATTITNPFDAVKTRIQLMPSKYSNIVRASHSMIKEEGIRSLFDGLGLRVGRKTLSSAIVWTLYEELIQQVERGWQDRSQMLQ